MKQEGVFVCQSCGAKYSVEDAKKMMGSTVETTEKVAVSDTTRLDNLYKLARRAKDDNNFDKAAQYYEQILLENALDWEAAFFSIYFSAVQKWRDGERASAVDLLYNCIDNVFDIIKKNVNGNSEKESAAKIVSSTIDNICRLFNGGNNDSFESFNAQYKQYGYSEHNHSLLMEKLKWTTYINRRIAEVCVLLANNMGRTFNDETTNLDIMAAEVLDLAIATAKGNPCWYVLQSYDNDKSWVFPGMGVLIGTAKNNRSELLELCDEEYAKLNKKVNSIIGRKTEEYWAEHPSEKESLESEKTSLNEKIAALEEELASVPKKTDGYSNIGELNKKLQDLFSEKKKLGLFKSKEKKVVQEKIDSTTNELNQINSRIMEAVGEANKRISNIMSEHKSRIEEIDKKFANPI